MPLLIESVERWPVKNSFVLERERELEPWMEAGISLPWYVVLSKPRQERVALDNLQRQGYDVYFPQIKVLKRIRGHQEVRLEPMFPRYIFVRTNSIKQSVAPIRSTSGVTTMVRFGFTLAVLRQETFCELQKFERRQHAYNLAELNPFKSGEKVTVVAGPLLGLEGVVAGAQDARVFVLLNLLGRDTRVLVDGGQLKAIS